MAKADTFFTAVGCMDGRVQEPVRNYAKEKFGAAYVDAITEAGLVGLLARDEPDGQLLSSIKQKLAISQEKHHSKGIVVHGHQDCAGNLVSDQRHRDDIRRSIEVIDVLVQSKIPVIGVFVKRSLEDPQVWEVEEVPQTLTA